MGTITAGTITGATFKTAASGVRVELTANNAKLEFYDSGNDKAGILDEDGTDFVLNSLDGRGLKLVSASGTIWARDILDMNSKNINNAAAITGTVGSFTTSLSTGGNFDMNNHDIEAVEIIEFNTRDSNASDNWCMYMYSSGGTYQLRVRLNGATYRADLTGV